MRKGFTLVELLLVIGILAVLFSIMTISYFGVQGKNVLSQAVGIMVADMRSQQTKAMAGVVPGNGELQAGYGIHFSVNSYTLFIGDTYAGGAPTDAVVQLPAGVSITASNFPTGGNLVFMRASGEMKDYAGGQEYYVDVTSAGSNETRRIRLNRLGVVTEGI